MKYPTVTGKYRGENKTAARYRFQTNAIAVNGRLQRPKLNAACLKLCGVMKVRPNAMSAYPVMVGTPAALTSDVKATGDGRMVHSSAAATPCMTMIAFFGSFLAETCEIQPEKGSTPSLATAQIKRELATPATVVLKIRPKMQTMFIKTCPPRPMVMAYIPTNGCGALSLYSVSKFGRQKRNKITRGKPIIADATADQKMPRAATKLAFLVSYKAISQWISDRQVFITRSYL